MSKVFLIEFILLFLMSCSPKNIKSDNHMMELINDLSKKEKCDIAYKTISTLGKDIIPLLLENSMNEKKFVGLTFLDLKSSYVYEGPTVGVVSLFLIESILTMKLHPYGLPLIVNKKDKWPYEYGGNMPKTLNENREKAIKYYKQWWEKVKDLDLEEIRKFNPLEGTELKWY